MVDLGPNKQKIAKLLRLLGTPSLSERRTTWDKLKERMQADGINWSDIGNWIEAQDNQKYTEAEMQEHAQIAREKGVEAGIQIARASANGHGGGAGTLPSTPIMAEYCHQQLSRLKSDWQRDFV